jgi:hypothetical protein
MSLIRCFALCAAIAAVAGAAGAKELGWLSRKYEVGNGGAGTVSRDEGDIGGTSYGYWQMTRANVGDFVAKHYPKDFKGLKPESKAFNDAWKAAAKRDKTFGDKQHAFIKATSYSPVVARLKKDVKFDVKSRSDAMKNVIWSTAVQHGPGGGPRVVKNALAPLLKKKTIDRLSDEEIIKAIYAERGRKSKDGALVWFSGNSKQIQKGVASRFVREQADALKALKEETK